MESSIFFSIAKDITFFTTKFSRTICDLDGAENILPEQIGEAIQYRSLDREGWLG